MVRLTVAVMTAAWVTGCRCDYAPIDDRDGAVGGGQAGGSVGGTSGGGALGGGALGGLVGGSLGGTSGGTLGTAGGAGGGGGGSSGGFLGGLGGGTGGGAFGGLVLGGLGGGLAGGLGGGAVGSFGGLVVGGPGGGLAGGLRGGLLGGAGGGAACVGPPAGTYVCAGCPGAADSNLGTAQCPVATLRRGLTNAQALGQPAVFVASRFGTNTSVYAEDVVVPAGVMLVGRHLVSGAAGSLSWVRGTQIGDRTVVQNVTASGLAFARGAARSTGIDGFIVRGAPLGGNVTVVVVSVVDASPTLTDFSVTGSGGGVLPNEIVGIDVRGISLLRANPLISGASSGAASTISGLRGAARAEGLRADSAQLEVVNLNIGEIVGPTAIGTHLLGAVGTRFTGGSSGVLSGATCFGVLSEGAASDVVFDGVSAQGCSAGNTSATYAVVFDGCPPVGIGANPVYRNARSIIGGTASSQGAGVGVAVGVQASSGCALEVSGNRTILGAQGADSRTTAAGVLCTSRGLHGTGADAPCRILGNSAITGSAHPSAAFAAGVECRGSCASSTASCAGSCAEIADNNPSLNGLGVTAGMGLSLANLMIEQSDPEVVRNSFVAPPASTVASSCTDGTGVHLVGSGASLANNLVVGPPCVNGASFGLQVTAAVRLGDSSIPSPIVHSNTILAYPGSGVPPAPQAGIRLTGEPGGLVTAQVGRFANNIVQAGPGGPAYAFEETLSTVDPVVLDTNDFFVVGATDGGVGPLYRNEGSTTLVTPQSIDALTDTNARGSRAFVPGLLPGNLPHIAPTSLCRGAGTSSGSGAPRDDWDGEARPQPNGTQPDIGADESP